MARVLPPVYEFRIRRRVFRWYAQLRTVDEAVGRRPADELRAELADEGVARSELDGAVAAVVDAVAGLLAEPRGRWLFDRSHTEARGEWALSGVLDHELVLSLIHI